MADEPKTAELRNSTEEKYTIESKPKPFKMNYQKFKKKGFISSREAYEHINGSPTKTNHQIEEDQLNKKRSPRSPIPVDISFSGIIEL